MNSIKYIEWQLPWILLLIPIILYLYFYLAKKESQNPTSLSFSKLNDEAIPQTWRTRLYKLPDWLKIAGLCFLILAISRPRKALVNESVIGKGIDIMLCIDLSESMLAQDFNPNRLEAAKELAIKFVNKRFQDRIGLVVFAGESFTQCPLTVDHEILNSFIASQETGYLNNGTAIGMGLATAVNRLKDSKAKTKVIVLLTDGANNAGYIDPLSAAELAAQLGIKVYAIGVGSDEITQVPNSKDIFGNLIFSTIRGEIDEETLTKIAEKTNGKYFRAKNYDELSGIYSSIDELEKSEIELSVLKRYKELFRFPLLMGLVSILSSILLSNTILKRFP